MAWHFPEDPGVSKMLCKWPDVTVDGEHHKVGNEMQSKRQGFSKFAHVLVKYVETPGPIGSFQGLGRFGLSSNSSCFFRSGLVP